MKVMMTRTPEVEVGNYDTRQAAEFEVRDTDDTLRGRLHISRGGVQWNRANAKIGEWMTWDDFISRMEG